MNAEREAIRLLVRTREDFQDMRKSLDNRMGKKADGVQQNIEKRELLNLPFLEDTRNIIIIQEKEIEKRLKNILKTIPIYNDFLAKVKGVGISMASWIIAEYDIKEATTVSKMWQYTGLNPGLIRGKKIIKKKNNDIIVETDELLRGDKRKSGYVNQFNGKLRTKMLGVLAVEFIKLKTDYAHNHYCPYKARLEQSDNIITGGDGKKWKETSAGHRNNAAKRYMLKMFFKDLYVAWRTLEGLPVRKPYSEEYLNKKHVAT